MVGFLCMFEMDSLVLTVLRTTRSSALKAKSQTHSSARTTVVIHSFCSVFGGDDSSGDDIINAFANVAVH